jgi:multidrug efflux pump subunit AcrA (membrane-fusion protein)
MTKPSEKALQLATWAVVTLPCPMSKAEESEGIVAIAERIDAAIAEAVQAKENELFDAEFLLSELESSAQSELDKARAELEKYKSKKRARRMKLGELKRHLASLGIDDQSEVFFYIEKGDNGGKKNIDFYTVGWVTNPDLNETRAELSFIDE